MRHEMRCTHSVLLKMILPMVSATHHSTSSLYRSTQSSCGEGIVVKRETVKVQKYVLHQSTSSLYRSTQSSCSGIKWRQA